MAKAKEKQEKPVSKPCICGCAGITVNTRAGKMITCPNPCKCPGGLRTRWHSDVDSAVIEWNSLVAGYRRK